MGQGKVVNENGVPLTAESPCRTGGFVFYYRELEQESPIPFAEEILYQDDHILVADKPHFLPVTPSGSFLRETLLVRLKKQLKLEHLVPLHRIDRETPTCGVFSQPCIRGDYASLFLSRKVSKIYEALAPPFPAALSHNISRGLQEENPSFDERNRCRPHSETIIDVVKRWVHGPLPPDPVPEESTNCGYTSPPSESPSKTTDSIRTYSRTRVMNFLHLCNCWQNPSPFATP